MTPVARPRAVVRRAGPLAAALLLAAGLGGCISLLPKAAPAQLYRFGGESAGAGPTPTAVSEPGARVAVLLDAATLPRAASGDGLLAVTGDQVAYVAGARWISPAVLMFNEAVQRAFDAQASHVRLTGRGALGRVQAVLRLNVRDFQIEYAAPGATPTVVVALHAQLSGVDGTVIDETDFVARKPASADRVSAIIPAYDVAVGEVLGRVVGWTDARAQITAAAALAPPIVTPSRR